MKKILLSSLIAAAAATPAVAGVNNINYQAVIKDANGVMADKKVEMKFELLDKDGVVYTEEQTPTTNAAGMVTCQLGGEDALTDLSWGDLTLRVSIKLGADYEVISNEAVSSVPTALYAVKSADSDMIIETLEGVLAENEETKSTLMGMSAEIARIDGLADDFENLGENLDNAFTQMTAQFEEVNGQLENLNMLGEVVRANEENIDLLTKEVEQILLGDEETAGTLKGINAEIARIDGLAQDLENLGENLDNAFTQMGAQFEEVNGQLENLNQMAAVTRANEESVEMLTGEVEKLIKADEETADKLKDMGADLSRIDGLAADFENLGENLNNLTTEIDAKFEEVHGQLENLNQMAAVTRANEESIETLTTEVTNILKSNEETADKLKDMGADLARIDGLAADFENLGENLNNLTTEIDARFLEVHGQLENLNQVGALARSNEEKIETLEDSVKHIDELTGENGRLMYLINKLQTQVVALQEEIKALKGE